MRVSGLEIHVVRKDIKNLHLAVYPPNGRVRVAVPLRMSNEAVRLAVITRLGWIKKQQGKFQGQERQSPREHVSGESHYFQGQRYRLNVIEQPGPPRVVIRNRRFIDLFVPEGSTISERERVLIAWYRNQLKGIIPLLIEKWETTIGVEVAEWRVKQMKTKWGSCNREDRRIWLNLELAKKSLQCLEYVIVHEMVHLIERHHNDRFNALMGKFMPQWKTIREELNRAPTKHEEWDC